MENVQHCRAMGSLFRQFAVFDPVHSWKYFSLQIFVTRAVSGGCVLSNRDHDGPASSRPRRAPSPRYHQSHRGNPR